MEYSDYDECGFGLHNCHKDAHCHNIDTTDTVNPIGFRCECKIGFHGDGFICNNIDECYNNQNNCGEGSTCKDITPTDAKPGTLVNFGNTQARFKQGCLMRVRISSDSETKLNRISDIQYPDFGLRK